MRGNSRYDLKQDGKLDVAEFRVAAYDVLREKLLKNSMNDSDVRHALG